MNDADVEQVIQRFSVSWYAEADRIDPTRIAGAGARKAALRDLNEPGALVEAMAANIAEAATNLDGVRDRYERARLDGLFDPMVMDGVGKRHKAGWIGAIESQKGDMARAAAELAHWKEYFVWAKEKEGKRYRPPAQDTRLPREPGDDSEEAVAS